MTYRDLTSRIAVLKAIEECDRLGRNAFLRKHGYGEARRYDSKAIIGVAFGYQYPDLGPLTRDEFSGGENMVQRKLEELGFEVQVLPAS